MLRGLEGLGDASSKYSWVAGWFQTETLEMANFYWPLTSAGSRGRGVSHAGCYIFIGRGGRLLLPNVARSQVSGKLARAVHGRRFL